MNLVLFGILREYSGGQGLVEKFSCHVNKEVSNKSHYNRFNFILDKNLTMGRWTDWTKIADADLCYLDDLTHEGPACYELGIRKNFLGAFREVEIMYVGETSNEKKRITAYAVDGSHLAELIEDYLNSGYSLFYRAQAKPSKKEAKNMQDSLLLDYEYEWNVHRNIA